MNAVKKCAKCGGFHHPNGKHLTALFFAKQAMQAANANAPITPAEEPRKRLTAREAMALSAAQFKETLAYLS